MEEEEDLLNSHILRITRGTCAANSCCDRVQMQCYQYYGCMYCVDTCRYIIYYNLYIRDMYRVHTLTHHKNRQAFLAGPRSPKSQKNPRKRTQRGWKRPDLSVSRLPQDGINFDVNFSKVPSSTFFCWLFNLFKVNPGQRL